MLILLFSFNQKIKQGWSCFELKLPGAAENMVSFRRVVPSHFPLPLENNHFSLLSS